MPQLEFSTWIGQIFWLIITFIAMYALIVIFVVPRMQSIAHRRDQKISGDLKRAEELKEEAERILAEYTESLEQTKKEAEEIINNAKAKALAKHEKEIAEFNKENEKSTKIALDKIRKAKQTAVSDVDEIVENITGEALEKVMGVNISKDEVKKAMKLVK